MTEAFASIRQNPATNTVRVRSPRVGDVLSGALHAAYDDHRDLPEDLAILLARLDRMERRPN